MELLIAVGIFGLIGGLVYFLVASRTPVAEDAIQRRLDNIAIQAQTKTPIRLHDNDEMTLWERVTNFFFGDKELPDRFNNMARRLHQAGYRGNRAVRIFWGLRIFLCAAFGFGGMFVAIMSESSMNDFIMLSGAGVAAGYMLPALTVFRKARARVREMKETLPDTLDLIVVCVEAGMGVD